ncbi:MAG: glycerophosphodiester phosphodiesterase [Cytophagaceae bacterium]
MSIKLKIFSLLCCSIAILCTCKKTDLNRIENLNGGYIDVIGHGGSGFQSIINPFPENSFVSIKNAVDGLNADGIEIDTQYSSDSILILFHDLLLEMSTHCTGCVSSYSASEITNCRYTNNFGSRAVNDENIITVRQLLEHFKGRKKKPIVYFSIKLFQECYGFTTQEFINYKEHFSNEIVKLIKDNEAHSWIYFYDGDAHLLNLIKQKDPKIFLFYNAMDFDSAYEACISNTFDGMVISNHHINKEQVKQAHAKGIKVVIWQLRTRKSTIEAIEKHPDGIMTDNIPMLIQILLEK